MPSWPDWWEWELELSPHLLKRMIDRAFNEADLRTMLENAVAVRPSDDEDGRWIVETRSGGKPWEVVVEPVNEDRALVVVTAYAVG